MNGELLMGLTNVCPQKLHKFPACMRIYKYLIVIFYQLDTQILYFN